MEETIKLISESVDARIKSDMLSWEFNKDSRFSNGTSIEEKAKKIAEIEQSRSEASQFLEKIKEVIEKLNIGAVFDLFQKVESEEKEKLSSKYNEELKIFLFLFDRVFELDSDNFEAAVKVNGPILADLRKSIVEDSFRKQQYERIANILFLQVSKKLSSKISYDDVLNAIEQEEQLDPEYEQKLKFFGEIFDESFTFENEESINNLKLKKQALIDARNAIVQKDLKQSIK